MSQNNRQFISPDSEEKTNQEERQTANNIPDEAYSSDDSVSSTLSTSSTQTTNSSKHQTDNPFDTRAENLAILAETHLSQKRSARLHKLHRFFERGRRESSKKLLTRIRSADRTLKGEAQEKFIIPLDVEDIRLGRGNSNGSHNDDALGAENDEYSGRPKVNDDSEDLQEALMPALQCFERDVDELLDAAVQVEGEGDEEEIIAFIEGGVISAFERFQCEVERVMAMMMMAEKAGAGMVSVAVPGKRNG